MSKSIIVVWEIIDQDLEKDELTLIGYNHYTSIKKAVEDRDNFPKNHLIQIGDSVEDFGFTGWRF